MNLVQLVQGKLGDDEDFGTLLEWTKDLHGKASKYFDYFGTSVARGEVMLDTLKWTKGRLTQLTDKQMALNWDNLLES